MNGVSAACSGACAEGIHCLLADEYLLYAPGPPPCGSSARQPRAAPPPADTRALSTADGGGEGEGQSGEGPLTKDGVNTLAAVRASSPLPIPPNVSLIGHAILRC